MNTINITVETAVDLIKGILNIPFEYEIVIEGTTEVTKEVIVPVVQTMEEKIDIELLKREEIRRKLDKVSEEHATKYGLENTDTLICIGVDMRSEYVESFITTVNGEPYLCGFPAKQWNGTKAHKARMEAERFEAAQQAKKDAEDAKRRQELIENTFKSDPYKMRAEYLESLREKYGYRSEYSDDWERWDKEEKEFERKKLLQEKDREFREKHGLEPLQPTGSFVDGEFRIDGMTRAEYVAKKEAERMKKAEENAQFKADMLEYGIDKLAGKPVQEIQDILKEWNEDKKRNQPTKMSEQLEQHIAKVEAAMAKEKEEEEKPVSLFANVAPIEVKPEYIPTTELNTDPFANVLDDLPWADHKAVL